jgi:hypothetical protein
MNGVFQREVGLTLMRIGAALVGVSLLFSLWASPDRIASLPWCLVGLAGVAMVLVLAGPLLPTMRRKIRAQHLVWFFLAVGFITFVVTILASRWPAYKLSWLNQHCHPYDRCPGPGQSAASVPTRPAACSPSAPPSRPHYRLRRAFRSDSECRQ